jgi:cytochrome c-type biogenesis protein CcmH/NrfG
MPPPPPPWFRPPAGLRYPPEHEEVHPQPTRRRPGAAFVASSLGAAVLVLVLSWSGTPRAAALPPPSTAAPPAIAVTTGEVPPAPAAPPPEAPAAQELPMLHVVPTPRPADPERAFRTRLQKKVSTGRPMNGQVRAQLRRGGAALAQGRFRAALRHFEGAAHRAPTLPEAWFGVALASFELRQDERSRTAVERVLELDPAHPTARVLAGLVAQAAGDHPRARQEYQAYLAAAPQGEFAVDVASILEQWPAR